MSVEAIAEAIARLIRPIEGTKINVPGRGKFTLTVTDLLERLYTFRHNDDAHHNAESLIQHISEVYDAVEAETKGWPEDRRDLLRATALLHDLGKAYTHGLKNGRHTFYGHNVVSREIAEKLLWDAIDWPDFSEQVFDLVLYHDIFFALVNSREQAKGLKYLKKFAEHPVSQDEQLENLIAFAKADSSRSRAYRSHTLEAMRTVLQELEQYRAQAEAKAYEKKRAAERRARNLRTYWDEIAEVVETAVPGTARLLPDVKAINKKLGAAKRYAAIKAVQAILNRDVRS